MLTVRESNRAEGCDGRDHFARRPIPLRQVVCLLPHSLYNPLVLAHCVQLRNLGRPLGVHLIFDCERGDKRRVEEGGLVLVRNFESRRQALIHRVVLFARLAKLVCVWGLRRETWVSTAVRL
jgi:hypothetical protein